MAVDKEEVLVDVIFHSFGEKGVEKAGKQVTTTLRKMEGGMGRYTTETYKLEEANGKLTKTLIGQTSTWKKMRQEFNWAYLNFMFAGMIISRAASQIKRSTTETFLKIEQGSTEAGTALIAMRAEFEYLKFTVGRAMGEASTPLLGLLIPLVRGISNFVSNHPEVTFAAIAAALTVGFGLQVAGNVGMFLMGMSTWSTSAEWKMFTSGSKSIFAVAALGAIGLGITIDGIAELEEGNIFKGLSEIFLGSGLVLSQSTKYGKAGTVMMASGLVLGIVDVAQSGEWTIERALSMALFGATTGYMVLGGPWGAALGMMVTLVIADIVSGVGFADKFANWMYENVGSPISEFLNNLPSFGNEGYLGNKKDVYIGSGGVISADTNPLFIDSNTPLSSKERLNKAKAKAKYGKKLSGSTYIPETGIYELHRGERVLSAGQNNQFSGGINITVNTSGGVNGDVLAGQIMDGIRRRTGA